MCRFNTWGILLQAQTPVGLPWLHGKAVLASPNSGPGCQAVPSPERCWHAGGLSRGAVGSKATARGTVEQDAHRHSPAVPQTEESHLQDGDHLCLILILLQGMSNVASWKRLISIRGLFFQLVRSLCLDVYDTFLEVIGTARAADSAQLSSWAEQTLNTGLFH